MAMIRPIFIETVYIDLDMCGADLSHLDEEMAEDSGVGESEAGKSLIRKKSEGCKKSERI